MRRQFFAQPVVPQDILFFLQEEIPEGAAVAMLTGVHPRPSLRAYDSLSQDSGACVEGGAGLPSVEPHVIRAYTVSESWSSLYRLYM